jgi:predicted fused transcriptional regulator/phosphomethylpyrimidine kinase
VTCDGVRPRHLSLLSDGGLEAVAILWEEVEFSALLPPQLRLNLAPLIPNKSAGYRDLVIFPGLVRVCTRARNPYCRAWEAAYDRDYFVSGSEHGAPDVVRRAVVASEAAAMSSSYSAAVLWDMTAFFR